MTRGSQVWEEMLADQVMLVKKREQNDLTSECVLSVKICIITPKGTQVFSFHD